MPVLRYFMWVGASLLTLLFIMDSYLPKAASRAESPRTYKIAVAAQYHGPEAVSFSGDNRIFAQPVVAEAGPQSEATERVRESFAKLDESAPQAVAKPVQVKKAAKRKIRKPQSDYAQDQQSPYSRTQDVAYSRTFDAPFQRSFFW